MNTAVFVNRGILSTLIPNWKKLNVTTRWVFLDKWDQEDECIYQELSNGGRDATVKPRPHFSKNGVGKDASAKNREARRANKGKPRDFASFGGGRKKNDVIIEDAE